MRIGALEHQRDAPFVWPRLAPTTTRHGQAGQLHPLAYQRDSSAAVGLSHAEAKDELPVHGQLVELQSRRYVFNRAAPTPLRASHRLAAYLDLRTQTCWGVA